MTRHMGRPHAARLIGNGHGQDFGFPEIDPVGRWVDPDAYGLSYPWPVGWQGRTEQIPLKREGPGIASQCQLSVLVSLALKAIEFGGHHTTDQDRMHWMRRDQPDGTNPQERQNADHGKKAQYNCQD